MRLGYLLEQLLAPVQGGTGRYSRELARAVAATAGPQDSVSGIVSWHLRTGAAHVPGVHGPRRLAAPAQLLARSWERGLPPRVRGLDLLHAPTPLAPSGLRCPLVVTVHDAVPWTHPDTLTPHGARWHRAMITRAVDAGATVVTPTQVVAEELRAVLPQLLEDRTVVLGSGVSPSLLEPPAPGDADRIAARLGLPHRFLLAVGTVEPRKGLDVALAALAELGPAAPPLVLAGAIGWGGLDLPAMAAAAGLRPGAVLPLGQISDPELQVVLTRARAVVMPSRAEGFGLPVAEAMALGTPVICSDLAVLREVSGGAAMLVPVGDVSAWAQALAQVCDDDELTRSLAERGRDAALRHSWPAVAARAWQLYRRLGAS